jgi:hypothetical protein
VRASLSLIIVAALASTAAAESKATVAVPPLDTSDDSLRIYAKPVADAIATSLRKTGGFEVESVDYSGAVPVHVKLALLGRIVSHPDDTVSLEVRIHDPERGARMAFVASSSMPLTAIDELAAEIAVALGPRVVKALAVQADRTKVEKAIENEKGPIQLPEAVIQGELDPSAKTDGTSSKAVDTRPKLIVFTATGQAAGGTVPVTGVVTRAGYALASRLGFQPVATGLEGVVEPERAIPEIKAGGANYGLMIHVKSVEFDWHGRVLSARGKVRVLIVNVLGQAIYDETIKTDTVVGSQGDRHAALVRFVAVQARDIVEPDIRRLLAGK